MKFKKEYLILGVVIVGLVAYLYLRNTDRTHYQLPALEKISAGDLTKIQIEAPAGAVTLSKKADKWVVLPGDYPADENKIKQMESAIDGLTLTALVSESESYSRYDLGKDKKITVSAWMGETLKRRFELGKTASSFKHTFVKIADDPRVYHARDNFRHTFEGTLDSYRDKTVLDFAIDDIREIHIAKDGRRQVFTKTEAPVPEDDKTNKDAVAPPTAPAQPVWQGADGETIAAEKINDLLATLNGLECDKYIYDKSRDAFENPVFTVGLKGSKDHELSLFEPEEKDGDNRPAMSSGNAHPFELTRFRADNIMKIFDKKEETTETP